MDIYIFEGHIMFMVDNAAAQFTQYVSARKSDIAPYTDMKWPRFFPLMKLHAEQYTADGFGTLMTLCTRAAGNLLTVETAVFTPRAGIDVPLLLVDASVTGKKCIVFAEFYDCTAGHLPQPELEKNAELFSGFHDYGEKPAWYIRERAPYSLIKSGSSGEADDLRRMARCTIQTYLETVRNVSDKRVTDDERSENIRNLHMFQNRMVAEGNPSSSVLRSVLGKTEAEKFFRTVVMPVG